MRLLRRESRLARCWTMNDSTETSRTDGPTPADRAKAQAVFDRLAALGIAYANLEHEAQCPVEESRAKRGVLPGGHAKNRFVKAQKGRLVLIVAEAEARIDLKRVHEVIGGSGRVTFGSAELLGEVLGVTPGSVTPFALLNDREGRVTCILHRRLMQEEPLNFHPLVNTMSTTIARDDLLRFLRSTGHEPVILDLPEPAGA